MRKKIPPLTALRSFEAAARHCSFRDAAEELCVSHSAISHQIKQLENHLGVELFVRRSRAVELTHPGRVYYPILREAFERIAEGTELLMAPQAPGILTIQLYSTFAIRWLIPRLPKFSNANPDIQVRLNTSQADVDFQQADVDLCVMIGSQSSANLHYDYLFDTLMYPVGSPALLSGDRPLDSPADLANHTILQVYPSRKDWYTWLDGAGVQGVDPESGLQFDSYDLALSTATQGMGIALGMQPYLSRDLKGGLLVELFPGQRVKADGAWYLVCRRERAHSSKVVAFREWILAEVASDTDLEDYSRHSNSVG
jgi:LysR family glycine cleavage system transcriptional activator